MEPFKSVTAIVVPLDRANVDTDAIIPKQFLKSIRRTGFGPNLFDEWRYLDRGEPGQSCVNRPVNPDFVLNQPRYQGGEILLAGENFGCGSSREHAPWALMGYGFRVIIAASFADIFFNNCFKNGILPVILDSAALRELFLAVVAKEGYRLTVDLEAQSVITPEGRSYAFQVDAFKKHCLTNGLDDIGLTMEHKSAIETFEKLRSEVAPWVFPTKEG